MAVRHLLFATIDPPKAKTGQKSFQGFLSGSGASFHEQSQELYEGLTLQPGKVSDPKPRKAEKIIIRVEGGKTGVKDVRDLCGVLDREKAAMGVLISLQPPTHDMVAEAVSTGFYEHKTILAPTHCTTGIYSLLSGLATRRPPATGRFRRTRVAN